MINFEVKEEFQDIFGNFTRERIGEPMAIVLDAEVLSAPIIQAQLSSGGVITGQFTEEEANTLALQLRSGALPIRCASRARKKLALRWARNRCA